MNIENNRKELLWISLRAPYDKVPHAGGRVHNYYLNKFAQTQRFHIKLVSFCDIFEIESANSIIPNVDKTIYISNKINNPIVKRILNAIGIPFFVFEYMKIRKRVKGTIEIISNHYYPDIIILQWTEIILLIPFIKKRFPQSKIVAIEEDVTFLKLYRKVKNNNGIKKVLSKVQYKVLKKQEIESLINADLVVLNNKKDCDLVVSNTIEVNKTFISVPYYSNYSFVNRRAEKFNLLFYGAMHRVENIEAAEFVINEIMPELRKYGNYKFIILGGNPPDLLCDKNKEKDIEVTGYVDDIKNYLEKATCFVAPLQMGAGIKIKILEVMSAGIPVLTNDIGIEGVGASNDVEYLHCETKEDYIRSIVKLSNNLIYAEKIGNAGKRHINGLFDKEKSIDLFIDKVSFL